MIETTLEKVIEELKEDSEITEPNEEAVSQVPTLEKDVYRKVSPQLKARYSRLDRWIDATHGDWLGIKEMEVFWKESVDDERLKGIRRNIEAARNNWENDAYSLFRPERLSIFAGSAYTSERIYLVWFDSVIEPELWVYDSNGESRYRDLESYLRAYLDDDLSASQTFWKLFQREEREENI